MLVVYERWAGDEDRLLYWPQVSSDHCCTSSSSWLGCSTVGHWGPKALCLPLALTLASLSPTNSNCPGHRVILLSDIPLLPLFFRLFTQVHLLIDVSVEGQYITLPLRDRVDLGAMAMKRVLLKLLHYWSVTIRLFNVISGTFVKGVLFLCRDAIGVF